MKLAARVMCAYTIVAILILGPLLLPGVILTFDMAWTGPGWLQKVMLIAIFVLAGTGGWRLGRLATPQLPAAAYLAGLIMVLNPFMYTRLMAGQYLVLAGAALLPHAVAAGVGLWRRRTWQPAVELGLVAATIGYVSVHTLGPLLAVGGAMSVAALWGRWHVWRRLWPAAVLAIGLWLVMSLGWIWPTVSGSSRLSATLATITPAQAEVFMTSGAASPLGGPALAAASLHGFWLDKSGWYALPANYWWFWPVAGVLGMLIAAGTVVAVRRRDRLGIALIVAAGLAYVLALGLATTATAPLTRWLLDVVPGFSGYREPHKWLMLTLVGYAYLAAGGLGWLVARVGQARQHLVVGAALVLPFMLVPMMLWGTGGQLRTAGYPSDWRYLREVLSYEEGPVLVLPWHSYLYLDFAGRIVANPAPSYFGGQIISSSNAELPGLPDAAAPGSLNRFIEDDILAQRGAPDAIPGLLANRGVKRVVVLKQADWVDYGWLTSLPGFTLVSESGGWQIWRVEGRL